MSSFRSKSAHRLPIIRWVLASVFGLICLLGAVIFLFDWNHARPHIARLSKKHFHQEIRIDGPLTVKLSMRPHISAEKITITSPEGVTDKNLFQAEKAEARLSIWPLFKKQIRILNASIKDGSIHLVSKDDGTTNWMFKSIAEAKQENAKKGAVNKREEGSSFEFVLLEGNISNVAVTYNTAVDANIHTFRSHMEKDDTLVFAGNGTYNQLAAAVEGSAHHVAGYLDGSTALPFDFKASLGDVSASAQGTVPTDAAGMKITVQGEGKNLHHVLTALGYRPNGAIAPFTLSTHIEQSTAGWSLKDINITLGQSNAAGIVEFLYGTPTTLHVDATSSKLHFEDFGVFFPASEAEKLPASEKEQTPSTDRKLYAATPLATTAFDGLALDIKADVKRFYGPDKAALIKGFTLDLKGNDGVLKLDPLKLAMEKGEVETTFVYDSRAALTDENKPRTARIHSVFRAVEIGPVAAPFIEDFGLESKKLGRLQVSDLFAGTFNGVLAAKSSGVSVADLMGHLNGSVDLALRDGKMSAVLVELAGLDLTQTIERLLSKKQLIDMPCLLVGLDANDGVVTSRVVLADTTDSNIYGSGTIDLGAETFDLRLVTAAKDFSVGSFTTPIEIKGAFSNPKVGLDRTDALKRLGAVAVLGTVIHPAAAIVALVEPGTEKDDNACQAYAKRLKNLSEATQAPAH